MPALRPLFAAALPFIAFALAAATPPPLPGAPLPYADAVDLALGAPVVAHVTITSADRLKAAEAADVRPGFARFFVSATVERLVRGAGGIPPVVNYLVDVPLDARGRPPRLKGAEALIFAAPVAGRPDELRLIAPDAERPYDPDTEQTVHAVLSEALGPNPPPRITGVGSVFHVPGTLPGESETQIFLKTANGHPVSLAVERRPGERPGWAVSLADMIDQAAAPPQPRSLLWYQLACGLPRALPAASVANLSAEDAEAARDDYRVVLDGLGPCGRTRGATQAGGSDESVTPTDSQSE